MGVEKAATRRRHEAIEFVQLAMIELAEARGHAFSGDWRQDGVTTWARECARCGRWIVIDLPNQGEDPAIRGRALAYCPGKRHGPVAARPLAAFREAV